MRTEIWFSKEKPVESRSKPEWFQEFKRLPYGTFSSWADFVSKKLKSNYEMNVDFAFSQRFKLLLIAEGSKIPIAGIKWTEEYYREPTREEVLEHLRMKHGNIAVIAGQSGIVEFDVDYRRTKRNTILRHFLDKTLVNITPRGYHLLFRNDVQESEGMDKVFSVVIESEADIVRKKNEYVVIPPSEITQGGIDRQKRANHEVNWVVGSYRWMVPLKPVMSYRLFLKRAKKLL